MRRVRRALAWLAAAGVAASAALVLAPSATAASDLSDAGAAAFADVASCAATSDHLLAAIVVDASGSLRQTDPDDKRVQAIATALDSLASLRAESNGSLDVQASLATFGAQYEELVGWGSVDGSQLAALEGSATADLPSRDRENLTDYRAALRGAQSSLDAQATAVGGTSCKVLLWFTDGRLDVDGTGGSEPATDAARAELCTQQGQIDGVRGDRIAIIALALFTEGSVTQQDQDRLQAIAEGTGGAETCGTVPIPATSAGGAFLRADDADAMRRLFAQAAALIAGGTSWKSLECPSAECVDGTLTIPADRGIGRFRVVLERDAGAALPTLLASDGTTVPLDVPSSQADGAQVVVSDREGLMTIDVTFPPAGSDGGDWTLQLGSTASLVDLYYFWGVDLAIEGPERGLTIGETSTVTVTPQHKDGSPVSPDELSGDLDLAVTVAGVDASSDVKDLGDGSFSLDVTVPAEGAASSMAIEATARGVSAPSEIPLGPVTSRADLPTALPTSYPTVAPSRLLLPNLVGDGTTSGTLTFTGSKDGATRACVADATFTDAPDPAGTITLTPDNPCVDVPADGTAQITVEVSSQHPADGRVDGTLPITLTGANGGDDVTLTVPVGLSMTRPVDEGKRWGLVALFSLVALLIAWLTAEVSRRVADRFRLTTDARVASVPVLVSAAGIRRANADHPNLLEPAFDFEALRVSRPGRLAKFDAAGLEYRRTFPWFPLKSGTGVVRAAGDSIVVTTAGNELIRGDGRTATVQLPGSVGFVLVAEPPAPGAADVQGRLAMVIDSRDGVAAALPDRLDEVRDAPWDRIVDAVLGVVSARGAVAAKAAGRAPAPTTATPVAAEERPAPTASWADDDAPAAPPRSTSGSDWADDLGPSSSPTPEPTGKGPRGRRGRPRPERSTSSTPPPAADDAAGDAPPSQMNWD